jgi:hypothetical protein
MDLPIVREGLWHVQIHRRVGGMSRVKTVGGGGGYRGGGVQMIVVVVEVVVIRVGGTMMMVMMVVVPEYRGGSPRRRTAATSATVELDVHDGAPRGIILFQRCIMVISYRSSKNVQK